MLALADKNTLGNVIVKAGGRRRKGRQRIAVYGYSSFCSAVIGSRNKRNIVTSLSGKINVESNAVIFRDHDNEAFSAVIAKECAVRKRSRAFAFTILSLALEFEILRYRILITTGIFREIKTAERFTDRIGLDSLTLICARSIGISSRIGGGSSRT